MTMLEFYVDGRDTGCFVVGSEIVARELEKSADEAGLDECLIEISPDDRVTTPQVLSLKARVAVLRSALADANY